MIEYTFDTEHAILYVQPKSSLEENDFVQLAKTVDPFIEKNGDLAGIIIQTPTFPGWKSLGAMAKHFRFVRDHHKHIKKIGLVTDSSIGDVAEHLASHFVSAEIRRFSAGEFEAAKRWIIVRGRFG
ncbi:MAG: STAS/SEC14 domain-containing protein [Burkholderiales bacterium]|nr:STAS/SEC14 domain-containing protein [Burkholderiales bacterium]